MMITTATLMLNETAAGSDPLDPSSIPEDSDNDKLPDSLEPGLGTDPI
jgi:hypothetical protein